MYSTSRLDACSQLVILQRGLPKITFTLFELAALSQTSSSPVLRMASCISGIFEPPRMSPRSHSSPTRIQTWRDRVPAASFECCCPKRAALRSFAAAARGSRGGTSRHGSASPYAKGCSTRTTRCSQLQCSTTRQMAARATASGTCSSPPERAECRTSGTRSHSRGSATRPARRCHIRSHYSRCQSRGRFSPADAAPPSSSLATCPISNTPFPFLIKNSFILL